jgi:hypothetical protein
VVILQEFAMKLQPFDLDLERARIDAVFSLRAGVKCGPWSFAPEFSDDNNDVTYQVVHRRDGEVGQCPPDSLKFVLRLLETLARHCRKKTGRTLRDFMSGAEQAIQRVKAVHKRTAAADAAAERLEAAEAAREPTEA